MSQSAERGSQMKCKECQKKITFDHYLATNKTDPKSEKVHLVFKCDCGFYVIPLDIAEITNSKALVSSGAMKYWKMDSDGELNGPELSRKGLKIYEEQGEEAYEKWKREVYFPLIEARMKRLKTNRFRKRA